MDNDIYLPEELLFEILSRLPVSMLMKFKCVCKYWYTLIGSPDFVKSHFSHENNRERLLFCDIIKRSFSMPIQDTSLLMDENFSGFEESDHLKIPDITGLHIVGPIDGIFGVVCELGIRAGLWNPARREFRPFPLNRLESIGNVQTGIGIDPLTGDYKLVIIHHLYNINYPLVSVYHSNSNSWRHLQDLESPALYPRGYKTRKSPTNTYMNGVYYWYVFDRRHGLNGIILAFDMSNDTFRVIQVPDANRYMALTFYGDSLALISIDLYNINDSPVDIWIMKNCGFWIKKFRVGPSEDLKYPYPFGFWKNNILIFQTKPWFLILCHVDTGEFTTIEAGKEKRHGHYFKNNQRIFFYKESLVSIKKEGCECWHGGLCSALVQDFFKSVSNYRSIYQNRLAGQV